MCTESFSTPSVVDHRNIHVRLSPVVDVLTIIRNNMAIEVTVTKHSDTSLSNFGIRLIECRIAPIYINININININL